MDEEFIVRLEQKADYHAREAERYRTAAEVLRNELPGGRSARARRTSSASTRSDPARSTVAMLEAALNEAYRPLHPRDLVEEMRRLGWQTDARNPVNTVRTAAHRLAEQGHIQRSADGLYARLGLEPDDSASVVSPPVKLQTDDAEGSNGDA